MFRVVIVDDVKMQAMLMRAYFKDMEDVEAVAFSDPLEAMADCEEHAPDLLLLDLVMPQMDGMDFLKIFRTLIECRDTPVVVVSGEDDRKVLYEALEHGANDFLHKPVDPIELRARAINMLKLRKRQLDIERMNEHLYQLATTDALTQLANRRHFFEHLEREVQRALRTSGDLCLAMIDADKFKSVNDTYGHDVGDDVLVCLARTLEAGLRNSDMVGRLGGEEFAVLLPDTDLEGARLVCERLRQSGSEQVVETPQGFLSFTVSIGLTPVSLVDGDTGESMLKRADEGLYAAKHNGRNRTEIFEPAQPVELSAL